MVLGMALIVSGALGILWRIYLPNPRVGHYLTLGLGFLLYTFPGRRVLDSLKSRLTYPRTGYVQPPQEIERGSESTAILSLFPSPPPNENVTFFQHRIVLVIFAFLVTPFPELPYWFIPVQTAALAATLYAWNRNSEPGCPWWSALALGLMGLVFLWVNVPPLLPLSLPLLLVGLWLMTMGGGTLIRYIRENPYPRHSEGPA